MTPPTRKILLVDDSPEDREVWRHHLAADATCRYVCVERDSLEGALEACRAERPDCILLDYNLPDGNGLEFIEDLRALGGTLAFPTVVLTATGSEEVAVRAMKAGAQDYLIKHRLDPDALHRALNGAVYKAHAEQLLARQREELEEAYRQAKEANARKDSFMAALSHELRTPLTPVLMTAAALREDERLPEDVRDQLGMIQRNVALEARLIDDLLDLSRVTNGKLALRTQDCDMHSLIGQVVGIVQDEAREKGIKLRLELAARRHHLQGDTTRLQQVLWNLLRNAVKFTPAGGQIRVRSRDAGEESRLRVEVEDSGIGLDPEAAKVIFNPFEQAAHGPEHRFGGLGLGLAIARAVVELHRGTIHAESPGRGRGATFVVELPGATVGEPSSAPAPDAPVPPAAAAMADAPLRLMVVEDHEPTRSVLERLLRRAGHQIVAVGNISDARATAAAQEFDAVVSDLGLPDGTGHELMQGLRDEHGLRGIALSGYGAEEDIRRSQASGFVAHLTKPVDFNELRRALRELPAIPRAR